MANAVIGALRVNLSLDTAAWEDGIKSAQAQMSKIGKKMQAVGAGLSAGVTAPLAAIGATALRTAGDFEASLNRVDAASGATAEQMGELRKMALTLGESTSKSASEAALALEMLAKNGVSVEDILGGAAKASVMLSEATGGDLSEAADVATNVMSQFKIEAKDLGKVVDGITGVTLSSQFGFSDYAAALGQAGGVAAAVGVELEDFNAAIAATSSVFTSGSDAGTSYKNFLVRLIPASDEAAGAMKELGLQFFEADGTMKSMAAIAEELRTKMSGLSEEALSDKMATIFGVDGMRTGIALMDQGAAGVERFRSVIGDASAEDQAAARMKGFNGELEKLKGALEGLQIAIASSGLLEWATGLIVKIAEIVTYLSQSNPALLKWGTIVAGLAALIGPAVLAMGLMVTAFAAISAPVAATIVAIAAVAAGMTMLYTAVQNAIPVIQQLGPQLWQGIQDGVDRAKAAIEQFAVDAIEVLKALPAQMLQVGKDIMAGLAAGIKQGAVAAVEGAKQVAVDLKNAVTSYLGIQSPSRVMHGVGENVMQGLNNGMTSLSGESENIATGIASTVSSAFKGLIDGSKTVKQALSEVLSSLGNMLMDKAFQSIFGGGSMGGGGGGGGMLSSLFSGFGSLLGFQNGGKFKVGGAGAMDSQLVAFRASPNETVSVTKPGQEDIGGGGVAGVRVFVDQDGNWQAKVESIADRRAGAITQAGIGQYNKSLPGNLPSMLSRGQARNG